MRKSLILTAILFAFLVALLPAHASAGTGAEDAVIDDPAFFANIENLIETGSDVAFPDTAALYQAYSGGGGTYSPTASTNIMTGLASAEESSGVAIGSLSSAEMLPVIGLAAVAGTAGWKIGGAIDHWMGWSKMCGFHLCSTGLTGTSNYGGGVWEAVRCSSATSISKTDGSGFTFASGAGAYFAGGSTPTLYNQCGAAAVTLGRSFPFNIWVFWAQRAGAGTVNAISSGQWDNGFSCTGTCDLAGDGQNFKLYDYEENIMSQIALQAAKTLLPAGLEGAYLTRDAGCTDGANAWAQPGTTNTATSSNCGGSLWRTNEQMQVEYAQKQAPTTTNPGLGAGTNTPGGGAGAAPFWSAPPGAPVSHASCTYASTCGTTIRTVIKTHTITEKWIVHELNPTVEPADPAVQTDFTVLQPIPNETYQDYLTRLRSAGWVGTFTSTQESPALSGYGPNAPTRIQYVANDSTTKTLDPLLWPSTVPQMKTDTPIVVRYNPATAVPAPTDSTVPAFDPTGPDEGSDNCSTCAINWTPIEDLDVGTKFPFGVPTWFDTALGSYDFDGDCRTLSIGKPAAIGGGSINIPFCSQEWEDTYRPIVFPILEALMTIAAVTFLGAKIFGIGDENG